jgi:hypothetical protein
MPRWLLPALLVPLALLFFYPLVARPTRVLYSDNSDALAQHIPYKRFLARAWQETGEIPLWCPNSCGGIPFISDLQVSIFYPPNLLFRIVPEPWVGAAFSWLIVVQIVLGGLLAYAYGREEGLGPAGAFVTGAGYMLSGKWLLHLLPAGHTVVIGLAWLPLVLLCFDRSLRRHSLGWAAAAGAALALLMLGTHPQWIAYAGLFFVVWSLGTALEGARDRHSIVRVLGRWLGLGALTTVFALALAAIQLLPTLEATRHSCRYQMHMAHSSGNYAGLNAAFPAWLGLVGPSLTRHPNWENQSGVGLAWAMAAAAGAWLARGRVWHRTAACCAVFAFALTGGLFLHDLPGLNLFRGPNRMLLLASLPLALLAGHATDLLPAAVASSRARRGLLASLAAVAILGVVYTEVRVGRLPADERFFHSYWPVLALTVPGLFLLAALPAQALGPWRMPLWCAVLVVDLLALSWPFAQVRRLASVYPPTPTLDFLADRRDDFGRVLDMHPYASVSPLGCGAPVAVNLGLHPVRGYNPLDFFRYKTFLRILSDSESPQAPHEIVDGFRLKHRALLDLLGVRYLLQPGAYPPEGTGWRVALQDPTSPVAFNYPDRGMITLPPYTVFENTQALPRAFLVPCAAPMPPGQVRKALLETDFRTTVLVRTSGPLPSRTECGDGFSPAKITRYQPNQVRVEADSRQPGWLVLTDMWYPGWSCTVDGEPRPIYVGNYLFRTVPVPAGKHELVFRFLPGSYRMGRAMTVGALAVLAAWLMLALMQRARNVSRSIGGAAAAEHEVCRRGEKWMPDRHVVQATGQPEGERAELLQPEACSLGLVQGR